MNTLEALKKAAKAIGLIFKTEYDKEAKGLVYILENKHGGEVLETHNRELVTLFLQIE